jgi:hypothetical protein
MQWAFKSEALRGLGRRERNFNINHPALRAPLQRRGIRTRKFDSINQGKSIFALTAYLLYVNARMPTLQ